MSGFPQRKLRLTEVDGLAQEHAASVHGQSRMPTSLFAARHHTAVLCPLRDPIQFQRHMPLCPLIPGGVPGGHVQDTDG